MVVTISSHLCIIKFALLVWNMVQQFFVVGVNHISGEMKNYGGAISRLPQVQTTSGRLVD